MTVIVLVSTAEARLEVLTVMSLLLILMTTVITADIPLIRIRRILTTPTTDIRLVDITTRILPTLNTAVIPIHTKTMIG